MGTHHICDFGGCHVYHKFSRSFIGWGQAVVCVALAQCYLHLWHQNSETSSYPVFLYEWAYSTHSDTPKEKGQDFTALEKQNGRLGLWWLYIYVHEEILVLENEVLLSWEDVDWYVIPASLHR